MWQLRLTGLYWKRHPWWLLSLVMTVALTTALAFVVTQLCLETRVRYRALVVEPLGNAQAQIIATDGAGMFAAWQTVLEGLPELETLAPVLNRQTVAVYKSSKVSVQVRGGAPTTNALLHPVNLLEGRWPQKSDKTSIVISHTLSKQLDIPLGESLELVTPRGFQPYRVVGISGESLLAVTMPLAELQRLFTSGERVDGFDLRFANTVQKEVALHALQQRLRGVATVVTTEERVRPLRNVLVVVRVLLLVVLAFSVVMVLCLLFSFLEASKRERTDEARTIYFLGVTPRYIARWQRCELSSLILAPSIIGLSVATFVLRQTKLSTLSFFVAGMLVLLILTVALRFLHLQTREQVVKAEQWGRLNLPVNLWLLWQLFRHSGRRYFFAVVILTFSLTGFTSMMILWQVQQTSLESFVSTFTTRPVLKERTLQFQEEYPLMGPLSKSTRWNMAMMPGVVFASSYLTRVTMEEQLQEDLYVLDVSSFPYQNLQSAEGPLLPDVLETERSLAISASLAESYSLKRGMMLRLRTPTGQHQYKIVAVIDDIGGVSRAMFIDQKNYLADWGRAGEGLFVLSLEETVEPRQLERLLREQLSERYARLPISAASFRSELEELLAGILTWCRWLMLGFVIVAALALARALETNVLRDFLTVFYLFGAKRPVLFWLTGNTVFLTTGLVVSIAFIVATGLSYALVLALRESDSYWLWKLSGVSYSPSLAVALALVLFLSVTLRGVTRVSKS